MNKKLSLIILFLLLVSLISILLGFIAFSKNGNNEEVGELKSSYEQLSKQVNELKVTTEDLQSKSGSSQQTSAQTTEPAKPVTQTETKPQPVAVTKTITGSGVNLRAVGNTSGKLIRQLSNGEVVTPTGATTTANNLQWIQVKDSKGNTGWVVSTYVK